MTLVKNLINKVFSLTKNYRDKFEMLSKKLPTFGSPDKTDPNKYFLIAEILEELFRIDEQFYEKFENIIDICMEEISIRENRRTVDKEASDLLSEAIHEFKTCKAKSEQVRERAYIILCQISTPDFTHRIYNFTQQQKQEINFSQKTLEAYSKKNKYLNKFYDRCIAKASKLFGIFEGLV